MPTRGPNRHRLITALALTALAASLGGCLQMASRPTASPVATPLPTLAPPATPTPTPGPPTPSPAPTFAAYTVKSGDNLTIVARKFHTKPRDIAYWNRAKYPSLDPESAKYAPNSLQVGWVLQVLPYGQYSPPPDATASNDPGLDGTPAPTEYLGPPTDPPSDGSPSVAPDASAGG